MNSIYQIMVYLVSLRTIIWIQNIICYLSTQLWAFLADWNFSISHRWIFLFGKHLIFITTYSFIQLTCFVFYFNITFILLFIVLWFYVLFILIFLSLWILGNKLKVLIIFILVIRWQIFIILKLFIFWWIISLQRLANRLNSLIFLLSFQIFNIQEIKLLIFNFW